MSTYISSQANRFYTALEDDYGKTPAITAANRIPALKLKVRQQQEVTSRKDKTGTRTFVGLPAGGRRRTAFELQTYMTSWAKGGQAAPGYGPLFQAALGGLPKAWAGGTVSSCTAAARVTFAAAHGLCAGQAVASANEIRFVAAIVDATTVVLNAPFTALPGAGSSMGSTVTYSPATELGSTSIFDYWSPSTAVQRVLSGAAVDELEILVNGDYHEFHFSGMAQDIVDTSSFSASAGQLESFPAEPALGAFDYSIVPGNLGQAWLGTAATQFLTITRAAVKVKNNLDMRGSEFGFSVPQSIAPGERTVTGEFELYSKDDAATASLYQAARQQSPISVMFQLGQSSGQMMAVFLKSVIPEVPEFDDGKTRLQWSFRPSRAQGVGDDEVVIAFG